MTKTGWNSDKLMDAYIAGFVDGDGCIGFYKTKYTGRKHQTGEGYCYEPQIRISNTNLEVLQEMANYFKGIAYSMQTNDTQREKACYILRYRGIHNLAIVLAQIVPHLRVKKRQAKAILEYCKKRIKIVDNSWNPPYTDDAEKIYQLVKSLNGA